MRIDGNHRYRAQGATNIAISFVEVVGVCRGSL